MALEAVIGAQGGKAGELRILFGILEKLAPAAEQRKIYIKKLPGGVVDVNEELLDLADDMTLDLERAEAEKVIEVLDSWQGFSTRDMKWMLPLRQQLRDSLEPDRTAGLKKVARTS